MTKAGEIKASLTLATDRVEALREKLGALEASARRAPTDRLPEIEEAARQAMLAGYALAHQLEDDAFDCLFRFKDFAQQLAEVEGAIIDVYSMASGFNAQSFGHGVRPFNYPRDSFYTRGNALHHVEEALSIGHKKTLI